MHPLASNEHTPQLHAGTGHRLSIHPWHAVAHSLPFLPYGNSLGLLPLYPVCVTVYVSADANFQKTGLERSAALASDLEYMQQQHKLPPPVVKEDGPGMTYAKHLKQLASEDPQSFICHYYNYYFAHTAGGRMIGKKVCWCLQSFGAPWGKGEQVSATRRRCYAHRCVSMECKTFQQGSAADFHSGANPLLDCAPPPPPPRGTP